MMVRPESLIPRNFYFFIFYYGDNEAVPHIETMIFCEKTCDGNGEDIWLFREASSSEDPDEELAEMPLTESQLLMVLDIHGLQKALIEMEDSYPIVRSNTNDEKSIIAGVKRTDFLELEKQIDEFLKLEKSNNLTITIRYTNDGLSLVKRNGRLEVVLFVRWKIEPEKEEKIRTFFQNRNVIPIQDYLSSRPRLRVLRYSLPMEESVVDIAVNLFKEVYEMNSTDEFRFISKDPPSLRKDS